MSKWWEQDMSDASQGMFSDPSTAIQIATMPIQLLAQDKQEQALQEQQARQARGGFLQQTMSLIGSAGHDLDGALSHVPGWGITKDVGKAAWYPVDKGASGAYWLYSNGVSRPLSTLILESAGADTGNSSFFNSKDWSKNYQAAKTISPGQAVQNSLGTIAASGPGWQQSLLSGGPTQFTKAEKQRISQQQNKFLYDTNYWQNKVGWKYNVGSGALDFMTSMGLDPSYAGIKLISAGVKGSRSIRVAGEAAEGLKGVKQSGLLNKATNAITNSLSKSPEQISKSGAIQNFFDWSNGKTGWEISQHPIWGSGRRINPAKDQLSQVIANADDVEKPLMMRFAMGDNDAASELAVKNKDLLAQIGRMSDNRQLVDSVKYDPAMFEHFMGEQRAGRTAPASPFGPGIGGTSAPEAALGAEKTPQLLEAPYPRPTTPGPRQTGWDQTYGPLQAKANAYRAATGSILKLANGVRPMEGAAATSLADALRFQDWKAGALDSLDAQIGTMQAKGDEYSKLLGGIVKGVDDFSPGESNLFGTMKSLYRMGPLALRDTEKAADATIKAQTVDRYGRQATGGFVARTIRQGYYQVPLRVVQAFGDQLPQTLVNHNDADASDRVLEMLKRVPNLGQDVRLGMLNAYSTAPDKVAKSQALKTITTSVVQHMAQQHNLSFDASKVVDDMIKTGTTNAYAKLQGKPVPKSQLFSTAENTATSHRADMLEDGDGWVVSPIAKTQLSYSEPLLDVKELNRFLGRNSGFLNSVKQSGGNMRDAVTSVSDSLSNVWKAATLLRPGYMLRAPSEEMAASAIKFGLMSSIIDSAHGGKNWALNRTQQLRAVVGKGSYSSAIGGPTSRVRVVDPTMEKLSKDLLGKSSRINVSKAWPVVMDRIDQETAAKAATSSKIAEMIKDPEHDPEDLAHLREDLADHQDIIDEHTDYAHELLRNATDSKGVRLGEGTIEHRGIEVPQAFSKEWENPIPRDQISSDQAMQTLFARGEAVDTARLIKTGNWASITKDEPNYWPSMLDALNKQWAQDPLFKRVAADSTLNAPAAWLKTPEGKMHLSQLGPMGRDSDRLLQGVSDTLQHYTASNPVLLDKIAKGEKISEADVRKAIQPEDLPPVHGEEVKGLTAKGNTQTAARLVDDMIEKGFKRLGTIPTDIISRHPTYLRAQEARMRQLIDEELGYQKSIGKAGDSIAPKQLNAMLQKSDGMARKDISQIVYDPTRTTATQALRFVSPFLSAYTDGLERWGGLVAEKPQFVSRAAKAYNAPVAANLVTDQDGNPVNEKGYATTYDENGKATGQHFVPIQNRTLHLKVPFGTSGLPKQSGFEIPIKIQALNTILPGDPWWNPGTGPIVQIPASQLAKKEPAMGDFLQWSKVLPYGPQGFMDSVTPKYVKDVWTAFHPNSDQFQQTMLAEYQRQVADHANGGPAPDMNKAEKNAKKFSYLKALTSWLSPAQTSTTPLTGTPYQFYIDQYKKMQQVDPKDADTNFLQKYGEDYFIFTSSLSKSMGIAPTVSALNTTKKYKDLIAGDSSLAPFIIGDTYNQGKFSSSAYAAEKDMTIGGEKVRGTQSVQDAVADTQRRQGWANYTKLMNNMDANLIRAGFHSYTQKGAEGFLSAKQQTTSALKQMFPAWEEDFDTNDTGAVPRRIQSFEILASDPRLANDPMRQDIPVLQQYLAGREIFKQQLANAGLQQLSFGVNGQPEGQSASLGSAWRNFQMALVASNTKFADVYNRYLSNDNLQ